MRPVIQLAPVKGITDRIFRTVLVSHFAGIDSAVAPFARISDSESKFKSLSTEFNPGIRTVPQVLTKSPEEFITLAAKFKSYGCDEVNWNLGCPFAMVIRRGEGAAMLPHPGLVDSFLEKIFSAITVSVSVKMRLGMHSADEILKIIPVLNNYNIKEVIIHARTGVQMYDGETDLAAFESALNLSKHPVIYNGDLKTADDYRSLSGSFPTVKGWMIGRGILTDPMLAEEIINSETDSPKFVRIHRFTDDLFESYNRELQSAAHVLDKMKGVWYYLSNSFQDSRKVAKRIRKAGSLNHYRDEIRKVFDQAEE